MFKSQAAPLKPHLFSRKGKLNLQTAIEMPIIYLILASIKVIDTVSQKRQTEKHKTVECNVQHILQLCNIRHLYILYTDIP